MRVGCNVVPPDREERSKEWAAVSSDREISSKYRLQSGLWSRQPEKYAADIGCSLARKSGAQQIVDCNVVLPDIVERSRYRL
jgi:hypothetical protein